MKKGFIYGFFILCHIHTSHGGLRSNAVSFPGTEATISYPRIVQDSFKPQPEITRYPISFIGGGKTDCYHSEWRCLGPTGIPGGYNSSKGQGQIHIIAFSPDYASDSVMYAGSNYGGLWKRRGLEPWKPLGQGKFPYSSISDIAIDPANKNILFVSTGDAEHLPNHYAENTDDGSPSYFTPIFTAGIFRTTDGGKHWQAVNGLNQALLENFKEGGSIAKIRLDPIGSRMWIAGSEGIYRTLDRNRTLPVWERVSRQNPVLDGDRQLKGLELHPTNPDIIYASGRDIYRSMDGGTSWESLTGAVKGLKLDALEKGFKVLRINLAVTPAAPERLYAYIIGTEGAYSAYHLYFFDGIKWHGLRHSTNYSLFEAATPSRTAIAVSPRNADTLFIGTTKVYGGNMKHIRAYSSYSGNGFHADVHALVVSPDGRWLYAATDGGISVKEVKKSGTPGWHFASEGLQVKTIYRFGDQEDRPDHIITGNQDTGTDIYEKGHWQTVEGGDGYNGKVDIVSGLGYAVGSSSSNKLMTYDFNTKSKRHEWLNRLLPKDPVSGKKPLVKSFQLRLHPVSENPWIPMTELYERRVHRPAKRSDTADSLWILKSDIGKYIPAQWQRQITEFDICPADPNYIYLVVNGYQKDDAEGFIVQPHLFLSTTGGCNGNAGYARDTCFRDITRNLIKSGIRTRHYVPRVFTEDTMHIPSISAVVFDPGNPQKAWITFTGYEPGIKVWETRDGGEQWSNADPETSLHNLPVNDIVYQSGSAEMLYIGTDAGIYFKDSSMHRWRRMCDFPNVRVTELHINYCMNTLRAASFGRGLWEGALATNPGNLGPAARRIRKYEAWDASRGIDRDIRIPSGHTLQIKGTPDNPVVISLPTMGRIILEDGATLTLQDVLLTNGCGNKWQGIIWEQKDKNRPPRLNFQRVRWKGI